MQKIEIPQFLSFLGQTPAGPNCADEWGRLAELVGIGTFFHEQIFVNKKVGNRKKLLQHVVFNFKN
jgi:hypothetical protein